MRSFYILFNFILPFRSLSKYYLLFYYFILSKHLLGFVSKKSSIYFFINSFSLNFLSFFLRFNLLSNLRSLTDIIVVDRPDFVNNRFEITYSFWNINFRFRVYLKLFANISSSIISISSLFNSSAWLEREVWDMFGIKFLFNDNLRRILTDYGFHGYPLRKDFPLIGFLELRYDDLYQSIIIEPLK